MNLKVSSICDIGRQREKNQDAILVYQNEQQDFALFLVADGMGGHSHGEKASNEIAAELRDWLNGLDLTAYVGNAPKLLYVLRDKMEAVNNFIWQAWNQQQICGSTCAILFLLGNTYGIFSVGDSRIYLSRRFRFALLTKDDVWENQASVRADYTDEELAKNPNYGKLLNAVGCAKSLVYNSQTGSLKRGDIFALCSDGVYKMCDEDFLRSEIRSCRRQTLDVVLNSVMQEVYRNGADDNASLILVKVG